MSGTIATWIRSGYIEVGLFTGKTMKDIIIIGGGAAGMTAAIYAKKTRDLKVSVLEKSDRVLKKLGVTGNGRGNISNAGMSLEHYSANNDSGLEALLNNFDFGKFCVEMGIYTVTMPDGRIFPRSLQASSVSDRLRNAAEDIGVEIICECAAQSIEANKSGFVVSWKKNGETYKMSARLLIAAFGGSAAGHFGTDGSSYAILTRLGHSLTEIYEGLVQLKCDTSDIKLLKGLRFDAKISLYDGGQLIKTSCGEILFTDYGVSGPAVFEISAFAVRLIKEKKRPRLSIDFQPCAERREILEILEKSGDIYDAALTYLPKQLIKTLLRKGNLKEEFVDNLKNFKLSVAGSLGFANAQITCGGIDSREVEFPCMRSKLNNNLFLAGELLDVTGDCGGYNLHFAFASGVFAGKSAAESLTVY
jgi:predicted Rossmann fold flavoprotein